MNDIYHIADDEKLNWRPTKPDFNLDYSQDIIMDKETGLYRVGDFSLVFTVKDTPHVNGENTVIWSRWAYKLRTREDRIKAYEELKDIITKLDITPPESAAHYLAMVKQTLLPQVDGCAEPLGTSKDFFGERRTPRSIKFEQL